MERWVTLSLGHGLLDEEKVLPYLILDDPPIYEPFHYL